MPILQEVSVVFIYTSSAKAELTTASFVPKCMLNLEILPGFANIQVLSTTSLPRKLFLLSSAIFLVGQALVHLQDS